MNLRDGKRGAWLGCSRFPKCRGRESFAKLPEDKQKELQKTLDKHLKGFIKIIVTRHDGTPIPEGTPIELLSLPGGVQELAIHPDFTREQLAIAKAG
jgi:DNA topoisomerase-1